MVQGRQASAVVLGGEMHKDGLYSISDHTLTVRTDTPSSRLVGDRIVTFMTKNTKLGQTTKT